MTTQPFQLGVNYWPRRKAMNWWSDFDAAEVREEFSLITDLGMTLVRIFLLWEDWQPTPDTVSPEALDNLEMVCDIAGSLGLSLDVTFFTGHMSGPNWIPPWMLLPDQPMSPRVMQVVSGGEIVNCGYRNPFADILVRRASDLLVETVVTRFKDHPAIGLWNLGNEPDLLAWPATAADGRAWTRHYTQLIKRIDPHTPVTCGLHVASLLENNGLRVNDVFAETDVAVMHGYPMYIDWVNDPLDPNFVPYLCALTTALSGKPTMMEEFGGCTEGPGNPSTVWEWTAYGKPRSQFMASEQDFARYIEQVLPNLVEVGATGAVLWCFADYAPELWNQPPCLEARHERFFGLVRPDGSLKPHAEIIRRFAAIRPTVQPARRSLSLDISAEDFYAKPDWHAQRLYNAFLRKGSISFVVETEGESQTVRLESHSISRKTMDSPLLLFPAPRHLSLLEDVFRVDAQRLISLNDADPQTLVFAARQLQTALQSTAGVAWEIVAGKHVPSEQIGVALNVVPGATSHPQGYALTITPARIDVVASEPVGVFYAVQTLRQILQQHGRSIPTLRCSDQPDFPHRGVMLDISRDKVPTMKTLYDLVDMLASWKINQLQLYTEHTFAYRNHPTVWADASPLTGEEILALDAYCRERFIELVPNQNTFGHMHRWLEHDAYRHLAEAPDGSITPWNGLRFDGPYSLSPVVPESLALVRDMLDELLPHFRSRQVNVGCDETFDLGQGLSQKLVGEQGVGRVYLDFLLKIHREVKSRGHSMQFWGDIIMQHPDLVPELPRDDIALEWGYEAEHPFDEHGALFADSGIPFYVCPGTSSWRTLAGRTDNALGNLRNAAENGLQHGAVGYLITDWGDDGHWQPLPVSYLGFLYGAALGWDYDANVDLDIPAALDAFVFQDKAEIMGKLVYSLGNVYQTPDLLFPNSSILFKALQASPEQIRDYPQQSSDSAAFPTRIRETLAQINAIMAKLPQTDMQIEDAVLVEREFVWAADMLRHACHRILWALDEDNGGIDASWLAKDAGRLIATYTAIWHERNRPGGFRESVARMAKMRETYEATTYSPGG